MKPKNAQWIDKKLETTLNSLNDLFDGEPQPNKSNLETFESHKQKQILLMQKKAESLFEQYQKAFDLILERLIQSDAIISDVAKKKAILNEIKIGQENLKKVIDSEKLADQINAGKKSFLNILKYSRGTVETFYELGLLFFEEQNFEDALAMFTFLAFLNPAAINSGCVKRCAYKFWKDLKRRLRFFNWLKPQIAQIPRLHFLLRNAI